MSSSNISCVLWGVALICEKPFSELDCGPDDTPVRRASKIINLVLLFCSLVGVGGGRSLYRAMGELAPIAHKSGCFQTVAVLFWFVAQTRLDGRGSTSHVKVVPVGAETLRNHWWRS